jgi:predicted aspartyl protease
MSVFRRMWYPHWCGTINDSDFIGKTTYALADGTEMPSARFRIRLLKVGNLEIQNVAAGINDVTGEPLLGQSFLKRFRS